MHEFLRPLNDQHCFDHQPKHLNIILLRHVIGDIEWQLIFICILSSLLYCCKDLIDLHYKHQNFITFWSYKYQHLHQIAYFCLNMPLKKSEVLYPPQRWAPTCVCVCVCVSGWAAEPVSLQRLRSQHSSTVSHQVDQWERLVDLWTLLLQVSGDRHQHQEPTAGTTPQNHVEMQHYQFNSFTFEEDPFNVC